MSDPMFKLQLLTRSEMALAEIHAKRALSRSGYFMVALILMLAAFAMMNVAAFLALQYVIHGAWAAVLVAVADSVCAGVVFAIGQRSGPSEGEERLALELRDMAYQEVNADVDEVKQKLGKLSDDVKGIGDGLANATGILRLVVGLLKK